MIYKHYLQLVSPKDAVFALTSADAPIPRNPQKSGEIGIA